MSGGRFQRGGWRLVGLCGLLAIGACQSSMSVEEARKVGAEFEGPRLELPPRGIGDILAEIEAATAKAAQRLAKVRAIAEAEPPARLDGRKLAEFYINRADHAERLGRTRQTIDDFKKGIEIGEGDKTYSTFQKGSHRVDHAVAMVRVGDFSAGLARLREAIGVLRNMDPGQNPFIKGHRLGRLAAFESYLGYYSSEVGDFKTADVAFERAQDSMNELEDLLDLARDQGAQLDDETLSGVAISKSVQLAARARAAEMQGDLAGAESLLRQSLEIQEDVKQGIEGFSLARLKSTEITIRSGLAKVLQKRGQSNAAEAEARRTLRLAIETRGLLDNRTAIVMATLTDLMLARGRFEDAEKLADRNLAALARMKADPDSLLAVTAKRRSAAALAGQGKWRQAASLFGDIAPDRAGFSSDIARAVVSDPVRGLALLRGGTAQAALAAARAHSDWTRGVRVAGSPEVAEADAFLAAAMARAGKKAEALPILRKTVPALVDVGAGQARLTPLAAKRLQAVIEAYIGLLRDGGRTENDLQSAFQLAERMRSGVLGNTIAANAARAAAGVRGLGDLVRQEQDLQQQTEAIFSMLAKLSADGAAPADQKEALSAKAEQLRQAQVVLAREIRERYPDYDALLKPKSPTFASLRQRLDADEALITVLTGDEKTHVWAIAKQGAVAFASADIGRAALADRVQTLRAALDPGEIATLGDIPDFDVAAAHDLYVKLLKPVEAGWKVAQRLNIVADGPLGALPFSLLPTTPATAAGSEQVLFTKYRAVAWLARSRAVSVLPTATALSAFDEAPAGHGERRPFVGFGDPYFNTDQAADAEGAQTSQVASRGVALRSAPTTRQADNAEIEKLPRLADTRAEITAIASALGADPARDVFVGARASEQRVKSMDLTPYDVISFATHGLVPGDLNGLDQPALALSSPEVTGGSGDGLLTMDEILGLKLNADFAVLSACNTAAADGRGAEAVSGLGRAFFYAGARALLVSNWPVHSGATTDLMSRMFKSLANDDTLTRAEALRRTKLSQIDQGGFEIDGNLAFSYAHPIFWAPFTIVGDGGGARTATN